MDGATDCPSIFDKVLNIKPQTFTSIGHGQNIWCKVEVHLYLFNQQNDLSLSLHLYLVKRRESERSLPQVMLNWANVVFYNLIFIGNGIVLPTQHQNDLILAYN